MHGIAIVVVSAALAVAAPAAQGYVYWTDSGPGLSGVGTTLGRANVDGNGVEATFVTGASGPGGVVSVGPYVYWGNSGSGASIARANTDGSGVNETFIPGVNAHGLATDGTYLYWTDGNEYVGRARLDGTAADAHFIDLGVLAGPFGIAVSGGKLYVGEPSQIVEVPATGGTASPFVSPLSGAPVGVLGIVAANGYLFFSELSPKGGSIGRVDLSGAGLDESVIPSLVFPTSVASDGTHLFWVDHVAGVIGRADLTSSGAANIQPSFITDAGGPAGVAVDSLIDPTATSVTCSPPTVPTGNPSVCTAQVTDSASSEAPAGAVVFSGGASTFFPGGNSCTLGPRPGGGLSCTVGAESSTAGPQSIAASYSGDLTHSGSTGSGQFCAGDAAACGSGGTAGGGSSSGTGSSSSSAGPTQPVCKVPRLGGQTYTQARKLLTKANCRLGKVTRPRLRRGAKPTLIVVGQSPMGGKTVASGSNVALRLGVKPPAKRRHHR
jgi:hypothetical protein